jgi:hypothetical protein
MSLRRRARYYQDSMNVRRILTCSTGGLNLSRLARARD